ncbi:hypothetical protein ACK3SF_02970 [Candidatus Nanosalina sp. VS9-1]|uniref:hypothetical protein n=1 Tax=Candidatus Nanosalina sp. VS9-1 TaxID=3388566 RepID=UPI0039E0CA07
MDVAKVIYRDEDDRKKEIETGKQIPGKNGVKASSVEIDEEGEWVMIHTEDRSGNEGSLIIPRERILLINEGRV